MAIPAQLSPICTDPDPATLCAGSGGQERGLTDVVPAYRAIQISKYLTYASTNYHPIYYCGSSIRLVLRLQKFVL